MMSDGSEAVLEFNDETVYGREAKKGRDER